MRNSGTPIHVLGKALNHISGSFGGVAGIYNRYTYFDEMRTAARVYEAYLRQLLDSQVKPISPVVAT